MLLRNRELERASAPDPARAESSYRRDIQGLRALAVLLVALDHAGIGAVRGGYVGVDVFFVLSGFLITGLLLSGAMKSGFATIADFYGRRARRILPAAALTLVATDLAAYALLNIVRAKQVLDDTIPASLFVANFHLASQGANYFGQGQPPSPLQHYWSLAVEEQFYLVWPLILLTVLLGVAISRRGRIPSPRPPGAQVAAAHTRRLFVVITLIGAASLAWSVDYSNSHPAAAYFSTFTRVWELALGAALAIGASTVSRLSGLWRAALGWLGIAAILVAATRFSAGTAFPGIAALLPTLGAALIIGSGLGERHAPLAPRRLLSIPPLRFIGDRSYAFYLWHWPVLIIALQYEGHALSVGTNILLLIGAFVLSIISYGLFENPVRQRWSSPLPSLLLWPLSVLAVIIVAGWGIGQIDVRSTQLADAGVPKYPGLVGSGSNSAPNRGGVSQAPTTLSASASSEALPAVVAAVTEAQRMAPIPTGLNPPVTALQNDHYNYPVGCSAQTGQSSSTVCSLGDTSGSRSLVVMGDSHAQMWMPAILAMADKNGWVVHPIGKSACIPLEWWHVTKATADCRAWYGWAKQQIEAIHPDVTLVAGAFSGLVGESAVAASGISSLVASVRSHSKHVVVLADQPSQRQQPVDCLLAQNASMARCSLSPTPDQLAVGESVAAAARNAGAAYIDTQGWFCFDNVCPMVIGHTIAYIDSGGHVSATYASRLEAVFQSAFRRATHRRATL